MNNVVDSGSGRFQEADGAVAHPDADPGTAQPVLQRAPMILRGGASQEYWFEEGCYITEWLNSTDDPSLSVARARVTPGVTTRLHRLAGISERYVILEGLGRVELVGPDGELTSADHYVSDVEPGDVVVIPPQVSQRISNIGDTDLIFLALCTPRFSRAAYEDRET